MDKTMSIQSDMLELKSINTEIRRLDGNRKDLKTKAAKVEKRIIEYLQEKNEKGVKTKDATGNNTGFILQTTQKTLNKTVTEKTKSSLDILRANGVSNAEQVLKELEDGRRGNKIPVPKLKIIQNK
jgi:hypothetical protein